MAWVDLSTDILAIVDGELQRFSAGSWAAADMTATLAVTRGYRGVNSTATGVYTLVLADAGKVVLVDGDVTVPLNSSVAFPVGARVDVIATGAGVDIAGADGVTVTRTTGFDATLVAGGMASLIKVATNTWRLVGNLVATV